MKYMQNTHDYYWLYGIICVNLQSLLAIAEWIEIPRIQKKTDGIRSLLAIAEWIEILYSAKFMKLCIVSASDSGLK